jgi:hypothetical protein
MEKGGRDVSPSPKRVNLFLLNFFRFRKVFLKFLKRRQIVRVVGFRLSPRLANAVNDFWLYGCQREGEAPAEPRSRYTHRLNGSDGASPSQRQASNKNSLFPRSKIVHGVALWDNGQFVKTF